MRRFFSVLLCSFAVAFPSRAAERAPVLEGSDATVEAFAKDALLFTDRNYTLLGAPPMFDGMKFVRASMTQGQKFRCVEPGVIYALTPEENSKASQADALLKLGFVKSDTPAFQPYGKEKTDIVSVFRKELAAGERIELGKWAVLLGAENLRLAPPPAKLWSDNKGELLYNGIRLPVEWPPQDGEAENGKTPAYLKFPPQVIPINVGRQLFVDDFLIAKTDLKRTFHSPVKYEGNPILKPETVAEREGGGINHCFKLASSAAPFDDGVFFDPKDHLFKMWYMAGSCHDTALAYSKDGLHWERPNFDVVPGTNIVIPYDPDFARDAFSPWIDQGSKAPGERYKAFLYTRSKARGNAGYLYTSADGIHWLQKKKIADTSIGDNTLLFHNPFRGKWCLSVRRSGPQGARIRHYFECGDFPALSEFARRDTVFWAATDALDKPEPGWVAQDPAQLYAIAAAPYESLMLGMFTVHYGPRNETCDKGKFPKLCQLKGAFSRDGFHWDRSNREVFIAGTKKDGDWDRAYLRAAGGCCLVVGDHLYFYYNANSGYNSDHAAHMYAGGSAHLAILRRDGFASMNADAPGGELVTRPVTFSGRHLFVNAAAASAQGELRAEILDEKDRVIEPFTAKNCIAVTADKTLQPVKWNGADDLSALRGGPVRFRFLLKNASLYAFWVSPDTSGASHGYVAAGGPGYESPVDTVGAKALSAGR
ncbi:MAG: glycosyl hydrolase family 32 [Candidatus Sumerlaeota bacterium]|nr:glycosyl hydrolase family 32 [Candidatus Sumerlaeota bacterium]